MRRTWLLVWSPVLLLVASSSASLQAWSLESLFYPMTYIENKVDAPLTNIVGREKRAAVLAPAEEYIIDIEITVPDSNYLYALRQFVKALPLPVQINISKTPLDITSVNLTTACTITDSMVHCVCERGYIWPNGACNVQPTCANTSSTCDCFGDYPSQGCEFDTTPVVETYMMLTILKDFDPNLRAPSSSAHMRLKRLLDTAFQSSYKSLNGFKSAHVINFREGSTIADYVVVSGPVTDAEFTTANAKVVTTLSANLTLAPNPFHTVIDAATITPNLTKVSMNSDFQLTCSVNATGDGRFTWNLVNSTIDATHYKTGSTSTKSILTATATSNWNGTIFCIFMRGNTAIRGRAEILVVDLPSQSEITVSPIDYNGKCSSPRTPPVTLTCCIKRPGNFTVKIGDATGQISNAAKTCYSSSFSPPNCVKQTLTKTCSFTNALNTTERSSAMTLRYFTEAIACNETLLGVGPEGGSKTGQCQDRDSTTAGTIEYTCTKGKWTPSPDGNTCVSAQINDRFQEIQDILKDPDREKQIPAYLQNLTASVVAISESISSSASNIRKLLDILKLTSSGMTVVTQDDMTNVLKTLNVVVAKPETWKGLNSSKQIATSSQLLQITDTFAKDLTAVNGSIDILTPNIMLKGSQISSDMENYSNNFTFANGSSHSLHGGVQIPHGHIEVNNTVVTIAYGTLMDILPGDGESKLNGLVMSTVLVGNQSTRPFSISMTFQNSNSSLTNASCVFWNFNLDSGTGGWDTDGCHPTGQEGDVTYCTCDHLTSFSILMSSSNPFTREQLQILDYITYIGVGISMGSLAICLIIEALVWASVKKNKTSYMRHVCIVNIAVSLLAADIWFIIGASMESYLEKANATRTATTAEDPCVAATFFTHYFYLSLFFWMLTMGLVLFYRLVFVFHDFSKNVLLGISFSLGYGCPLIIAIITVAVTQPSKKYRAGLSCWLNMTPTRAFLAFVVPALLIVAVNLMILVVVLTKLMRPAVGDKPRQEEKSSLIKISKTVAILTPLLGLTWGFGIGTVVSSNIGIHGTFAALNSLQGLFILLFGTLWNTKVRAAMLSKFAQYKWTSQLTKSSNLSSTRVATPKTGTRAANAPKTPKPGQPMYNIFGQKRGYDLSSAFKSSSDTNTSNSYSTLG